MFRARSAPNGAGLKRHRWRLRRVEESVAKALGRHWLEPQCQRARCRASGARSWRIQPNPMPAWRAHPQLHSATKGEAWRVRRGLLVSRTPTVLGHAVPGDVARRHAGRLHQMQRRYVGHVPLQERSPNRVLHWNTPEERYPLRCRRAPEKRCRRRGALYAAASVRPIFRPHAGLFA